MRMAACVAFLPQVLFEQYKADLDDGELGGEGGMKDDLGGK
jgi:hypothetical protein